MEEGVLLPEGFVCSIGMRALDLALHIRVGDLRDGRDVEDASQQEDEARDAEVDPLDALEGLHAVAGVLEEDVGAQDGAHHRANRIEALREIDSQLGVAGWPADSDIGVCSGFEGAETAADDEGRAAEAAEGALEGGRPHHEGADAVEAESEHEDCFVAEVAQDPIRVAEGGQRVGAEVGGLQAGGAGAGDA